MGSYGKKSLKDSFKAGVRKIIKLSILGAVVAGPAYYQYGTFQEQDVTITAIDKVLLEQPALGAVPVTLPADAYKYTIRTDKGLFKNNNAYAHLKFNSEDIQETLVVGRTYRIKTYGSRLALPVKSWSFYPNILNAQEVVKEQPQAQQALSGETVTYTVKAGDSDFQVTVPVEVKGRVTVEKVAPAQTAPTVTAPRPPTP